ncbi:MAG: hypothetical protein RJB66_1144 [Pseudomonadota bacterium]|jgi:hypothetical protein
MIRTKFSRLFNVTVFAAAFIAMASCAHKEFIGELVESIPAYKHEFEFADAKKLRDDLKKISDFKKTENQQYLVKILIAYNNLKKAGGENKITLAPYSKTRVVIASFYASSGKATPEQKEIFKWAQGTSKISLIKEVLDFYAKNPGTNTQRVQELIWNLENETYYDEYPDSLKELVKQVSPTAPLTLPSRLKSQIVDEITPQKIKEAAHLVKGNYYSFKEFKKIIENKRSSFTPLENNLVSKLPGTGISATTSSNGYESQVITFYNPTNAIKTFQATKYYLRPVRDDVQPIILASVFPYGDEIQKILEEQALKLLGYLSSQYPTLNPSEKDLVKQNPIEAAVVFYNAFLAEKNGDQFFPHSGINGAADSFRHFVWAGLLTRDLGEEPARKFLNAHELNPRQSLEE